MEKIYDYNVDVNFLNSYNLKTGNYRQALYDFEYVIGNVKDHAIAHRQASVAASKLNLSEKAKYHAKEEKRIMSNPNMFQKYYKEFSINPIFAT